MEACEFPVVGRVDYRSNWAPSHYLRWVLSIAGENLFQILGIDNVEIWWLRAVAESFRYGVAFAHEKARGAGRLRHRSGAGEVYDLAEAMLPSSGVAGTSEGGHEEEEDEGIHAVRHVYLQMFAGLGWEGSSEGSGGSQDSTTTSDGFGSSEGSRGTGEVQEDGPF